MSWYWSNPIRWLAGLTVSSLLTGCPASGVGPSVERYQKLDAKGRPLDIQQGPWACVLDRQTGLIWENKTDNEGLHYEAATYSWFSAEQGTGRPKAGSCVGADMGVFACDSSDLLKSARQQQWCGQRGWQIPTHQQLHSLLHDTGFAGNPRIATGFFPNTGRMPYWTADWRLGAQGEVEALQIHFGTAEAGWLSTRHAARLRLVVDPAVTRITQP